MEMGGGFVIELDIKSFFDTVSHVHLRAILDQRVRDGLLRRMINRWLKAGVLEGGTVHYPSDGTPQGGVVSPLLANIYLHEVLDRWFQEQVRPRMHGRAELVRYADDAVMVFASEADARRVLSVLPKRFGKYGLTLHPEKTRLVEFRPPRSRPSGGTPRSFDFLGFCHFWGKSQKGRWVVKRKTASSRFTRALRRVAQWCARHLHDSLSVQQRALTRMLHGHYGYFGITGNSRSLTRFRFEVVRIWRRWLNRRSQGRTMPWERFVRLLRRYRLPTARAVHSICAGYRSEPVS